MLRDKLQAVCASVMSQWRFGKYACQRLLLHVSQVRHLNPAPCCLNSSEVVALAISGHLSIVQRDAVNRKPQSLCAHCQWHCIWQRHVVRSHFLRHASPSLLGEVACYARSTQSKSPWCNKTQKTLTVAYFNRLMRFSAMLWHIIAGTPCIDHLLVLDINCWLLQRLSLSSIPQPAIFLVCSLTCSTAVIVYKGMNCKFFFSLTLVLQQKDTLQPL
jgi:hypothetical protein